VSGPDSDDAELVLASARGDAAAFAVLVRRHIRNATILAVQLLGDQDDAEDIVQVAFTIVYERARTFDGRRPFTPWLFAIVRRLAANKRARDARRERLLGIWGGRGGVVQPSESNVHGALDAQHDEETVREALDDLSPMQRACFELVSLRGISTGEAAAMHGISESTVRQHIHRARRALRHALQASGRGANELAPIEQVDEP